jgi:putative endonuclease
LSQSRQELGRWGEAHAAEYLVDQGYTIVARNERTPYGEIDLVAQKVYGPTAESHESQEMLVFVEVKTRTSQSFGYPEEAVTPRKQINLISAAQHYLQEHPDLDLDWRIDVISIERYPDRAPIIHHFDNALR